MSNVNVQHLKRVKSNEFGCSSLLTERPETVEVDSNVLAGTDPEKIQECTELMLEKANEWANPFGDGTAGERIVTILSDRIRC